MGIRSEIVVVEGFRSGRRIDAALRQSTCSAESWLSQNALSSASLRNFGTGFIVTALRGTLLADLFAFTLAIEISLLSTHAAR